MLTQWITVSSHLGQDLQHLIQSMHEQAGVRALMPRICNANLKGMAQDCTVRLAKFQSLIFFWQTQKNRKLSQSSKTSKTIISSPFVRRKLSQCWMWSWTIAVHLCRTWQLLASSNEHEEQMNNIINMNMWYIIWIYIYMIFILVNCRYPMCGASSDSCLKIDRICSKNLARWN